MKTPDLPYPAIHTEEYPVEWSDGSALGRLSLTGLFNMVQLTAAHHADICRFGFREMTAAGQAWVLNRLKIRFSQMPPCGGKIRVTTWIQSSNGILSRRNMSVEHDGQLIAQVSTLWVCIDLQKRSPESIAIDYPGYLILPEKEIGFPAAARIRPPGDTRALRTYRAAFSDIDAMGHVNNVKYTQWILDSIPYEAAVGLTRGEIELNFVAEVHPGENVVIEQGGMPAEPIFVVRRKTDDRVAFLSRYRPCSDVTDHGEGVL